MPSASPAASPNPSLPVAAETFLGCCEISLALAARPEVAAAWAAESSCEGMTVGGLAHHLVAQVRSAARLLAAPEPDDAPVIGLLEHYDRAPWVAQSRSGEVDPEQNGSDNTAAGVGQVQVIADAFASFALLEGLLAGDARPEVVHIPWQGWSLPTDAFLTTRLMEMVVHGDDLAASVGIDSPEHDESVTTPVLGLLAAVAARRHGQVAVVRALSRPQRSSGDISAF